MNILEEQTYYLSLENYLCREVLAKRSCIYGGYGLSEAGLHMYQKVLFSHVLVFFGFHLFIFVIGGVVLQILVKYYYLSIVNL